MVKIDLVTGFLGSGKTSFIKEYATFLMNQGQNIGILENDYGAVNVDMMLLQDLEGEKCELEMVAGGCDYDCHKRRFKTKLIAMGMCGYDRVIVEPSGIYDVDEFFDVLYEEPLDRWYEVGNVFAIVDGNLEDGLSEQSDYLMINQIASAGKVIFSKCQESDQTAWMRTIEKMNRVLEQYKCQRAFKGFSESLAEGPDYVLVKDWNQLTDEDFELLASSGYKAANHVKAQQMDDYAYDTVYYMNLGQPLSKLQNSVKQVFADSSCGHVFRVKGFVQEGIQWYQINATGAQMEISKVLAGQDVLIIIGEHLEQSVIDRWITN